MDSLSILLHAGIACLASLVYDWVTACWDGMSTLICWDSSFCLLAHDWLITNGCFNPISVISYYGIAHSPNSLRIASSKHKMAASGLECINITLFTDSLSLLL